MALSAHPSQPFDVIILGAGAAGLLCAALAARRGLRVLLIDHAPKAGRKILISGGGRSNFTHLHTGPEHFLSENPHFVKSALARYAPQDFVALVERYGIAYHAKSPGQLFCDGSASQIVAMLLDLCARAGVTVQLQTSVFQVEHAGGQYRLLCGAANGAMPEAHSGPAADPLIHKSPTILAAPSLVIATGGLSIPKLGASSFGYDVAGHFGLRVVEPRPALVPLLFNAKDRAGFDGLSGVATEVRVACNGADAPGCIAFRDKMLITHRGLSGPAILQVSSYWRPGSALELDLAPGQHVTAPLLAAGARRDGATAAAAWQAALPRRLADRLLATAAPANWRTPALEAAEHRLHHWPLTPSGTEGYDKAEVTAGGVATDELSARTMEARRQPGLYFIGEVVDVTGHLGGYNFQWAWASAAAAAQAL